MTNYIERHGMLPTEKKSIKIIEAKKLEDELFSNIKSFHEAIEKNDFYTANELTPIIEQQKNIYAKFQAI